MSAAPADAARVGGTVRVDDATQFGTMHYRASRGVPNRVTVRPAGDDRSAFVIRDRAEPVRARGDCRRIGRHAARCPWSESDFAVRILVRDRSDVVRVRGGIAALVRGGRGHDRIVGTGGALHGDRGRDRLFGGRFGGRLSGGPGRDRMEARGSEFIGGNWTFVDDERDAQAARDVMVVRRPRGSGATVSYAKRRRPLTIDLRRGRAGPEGDVLRGVTGVIGGAGDDVLIGTAAANAIEGGPGDDRIYGRGGDDRIGGGPGDDLLRGGPGKDTLTDVVGADVFVGGRGADVIHSHDGRTLDPSGADRVSCDARDRPVQSDRLDRLELCRQVKGWDIADLEMFTRPRIDEETATFTLRCGPTEMEQRTDPDSGFSTFVRRCRGVLVLRSLDGEDFGSASFEHEMGGFRTPWVTVEVPLTAAAREALRRPTVIEVEAQGRSANGWEVPPAGYRTTMHRQVISPPPRATAGG